MEEQIPKQLLEALGRYKNYKIAPGHFLTAILEGDLFMAYARADDTSFVMLPQIIIYIVKDFPRDIYGSKWNVRSFLDSKE